MRSFLRPSLTGDGVLLYNDPGGAGGGSLNIGGQGSIVLTPPTSGPYAGISIFQARNATQSITFGESSVARISGAVYAAAAAVVLSGSTNVMIGGGQADVLGVGLIADDLEYLGQRRAQCPDMMWQREISAASFA